MPEKPPCGEKFDFGQVSDEMTCLLDPGHPGRHHDVNILRGQLVSVTWQPYKEAEDEDTATA